MAFEKGTSVWLKIGSPKMIIKYRDTKQQLVCNWFVGEEIREHAFREEQLTETKPETDDDDDDVY